MAQIKKASRQQVKVKIGMMGISGSGKTMSALLLGYGLLKATHPEMSDPQIWEKILVVDTENQSSALYAGIGVGGTRIGEFLTIDLEAPFTVDKYIDAINTAEDAGVEFLIIDSMSHAWQSEGGLLDKQATVAKRMNGQSYQAWREITPLYNKLIDRILQCNMHVVSTYRGKKEYALEEGDNGRKKVTAKGMGAQFREGADYESTVYFEIDQNHGAIATKDRTHLFDGQYFLISPETGKQIYQWLSTAAQAPAVVKAAPAPAPAVVEEAPAEPVASEEDIAKAIGMVDAVIKEAAKTMDRKELSAKVKSIAGVANYKSVKDINILRQLYAAFAVKEEPNE